MNLRTSPSLRAVLLPVVGMLVVLFAGSGSTLGQQGRDMGCSPTLANPCNGNSSGGSSGGSTSGGRTLLDDIGCALFGGPGCPEKPDNRKGLARELNERGVAAFNREDYAAAVRYLEQAAKYNPDSEVIRSNLQIAKDRLAARLLSDQQEREAAERRRKAEIADALRRNKGIANDLKNTASDYGRKLEAVGSTSSLDFILPDPSAETALVARKDDLDFTQNADASVVDLRLSNINESRFLFATQSQDLVPMMDGGHPIDIEPRPLGRHGLVGGTTWTFGFRWPYSSCDAECRANLGYGLKEQLRDYCSKKENPQKCFSEGLPFSSDEYDMVVSMARSHSPIVDLATRVIFDNATLGQFTAQNPKLFRELKDQTFDTLDCHSNGAMLCLAALRGKITTAKVVRLFGPQITPEAAAAWKELANDTKNPIKVEIYINTGDPVPGLSWGLPKIATDPKAGVIGSWITNGSSFLKGLAPSVDQALSDSLFQNMDKELAAYGFKVNRSSCSRVPSVNCHSMKLYEEASKTK